jgi:hypothetical protein
MRNYKLSSLVEIKFLDHATGKKPVLCTLWGKIVEIGDNHISIRCWESNNGKDHDDFNHDEYAILTQAIKSLRYLK